MLFTLTWTAQNFPAISGAVSHSVTRDDSKVIGVKIQHNSGNNVDRNKRHRFSANIKMALDQSDPVWPSFLFNFG